ncbi:MAG: sigma-70 family RNA polymerase sigma factor [Planctomycetales bacterium]|nr:sigma-70 family RNA polymerase sigma factor [Planctomycetales bacterium]
MTKDMNAAAATGSGLLRLARHGNVDALGQLMARHVTRLESQVRLQLGRTLQAKVDPSDVVQDTLLDAHRQFPTFRGDTETDFVNWLKQILAGQLARAARTFLGTRARDASLERSIEISDRSSAGDQLQLAGSDITPSGLVSEIEQFEKLQGIVAGLPEDYRKVITLRAFEGCSFGEIAKRMDRTVDSVQKLWVRGLILVRRSMLADGSD